MKDGKKVVFSSSLQAPPVVQASQTSRLQSVGSLEKGKKQLDQGIQTKIPKCVLALHLLTKIKTEIHKKPRATQTIPVLAVTKEMLSALKEDDLARFHYTIAAGSG